MAAKKFIFKAYSFIIYIENKCICLFKVGCYIKWTNGRTSLKFLSQVQRNGKNLI